MDDLDGTEWCEECLQWVDDFCSHVEVEHPDIIETILEAIDGRE